MKRICALLAVLLLLGGCKPAADELISVGTEDGGGSGYGVSVKSVLKLSDFYFITRGSTRDNNTLVLGTPVYTMGESDTYHLEDGSQVVLTYDAKGILEDFGLAEYFTMICGASTDTHRNTKEAVIAHLMESNPDAKNFVMIGDTIFDVEGAASLGIPTIGVSWGYGNVPDMVAAGAVAIADSTQELYQLLNA